MTLTMLALLIYGNEVRNYHSKCTLRGDGVDTLAVCIFKWDKKELHAVE